MFNILFFYVVVSSAVFVYGIGLNKLIIYSADPTDIGFFFLKTFLTVILSMLLCWPVTQLILVPADLTEMYPLFCLFITYFISMILTEFSARILKKNTAGFSLSFLTVLLAVNEGITFGKSIAVALACIVSFFFILPLIYAVRKRMKSTRQYIDFKDGALVLLSIAAILFILFAFNVSWLNPEVL